jgi:DNA-binding SARP family transcriptional activator
MEGVFRVLGPLEAEVDGVTVTPTAAKERTLLAILVMSGGRVIAADRLVEELWPQLPADRGRRVLHVRIAALRKLLKRAGAEGLIQSAGSGYRLAIDPATVDAGRFEALTERARDHSAAGEPAEAAASLREALALWRGEPLAGIDDCLLLEAEVARLRDARIGAIEDRIEADLACGRHHAVVSELEGLLAANPLRERLWGQRVLALYRCGRQAEALRACSAVRRHLAEELGVEPGPALRAMEQAVLEQRPALAGAAALPPAVACAPQQPLVERALHLSVLDNAAGAVRRESRGRIVLLSGEAGVGKTAVIRHFCDEQGSDVRVLWGRCDALFTPRPLGPFVDVAEAIGGDFASTVANGGKPFEVATALLRALQRPGLTILVLDDLHSADEATLDVVRLLGRRVEGVPALVLASYRDDVLERTHPLRTVIGDMPSGLPVIRLAVGPLSPAGVDLLAGGRNEISAELYEKTGGNPFFVTEVLAADGQAVPASVRDAVLARCGGLSPAAHTMLEAVAVVPQPTELWLLRRLAGAGLDELDECLTSGILTSQGAAVAFRHELARTVVESSVPVHRRIALHERAVAALAAPAIGAPDLARLAHHADAAGDAEATLRFAPAAGARAAELGAHREAAAQFERALRYAEGQPLGVRAQLLSRRSIECFLTDDSDAAIAARQAALECYRALGDQINEGDSLRWLARLVGCRGRIAESIELGEMAVAVLERCPPGRELAMAYSHLAAWSADDEDAELTGRWGAVALELAETLDEIEVIIHALNSVGLSQYLNGAPEGRARLERSLALAQQAGLAEHAGRAFIHLAWAATRHRSHDAAERTRTLGLEYCREHGLDLFRVYLDAYGARSALDRGRWPEADTLAESVLRAPLASTLPRVIALVVLGLVRLRRGEPGAPELLDEASALAGPAGELQYIGPVAAARAEAAWLEGRLDDVAAETERAFAVASRRNARWMWGELACWRWRAGIDSAVPADVPEPFALELAGEPARAAAAWAALGCPYEAALLSARVVSPEG